MQDNQLYDEPCEVDAQDGVVLVTGPGAIRVRFTPDAAEETSDRLTSAAMKARGQRYFSEVRGD